MSNLARMACGFCVLVTISLSLPASAITVELAKKCRAMAIKAHPTVLAGGKSGTAKAQRDFYQACISKNGNMPDDDAQKPAEPAAK